MRCIGFSFTGAEQDVPHLLQFGFVFVARFKMNTKEVILNLNFHVKFDNVFYIIVVSLCHPHNFLLP
jgi:hypothetical protein